MYVDNSGEERLFRRLNLFRNAVAGSTANENIFGYNDRVEKRKKKLAEAHKNPTGIKVFVALIQSSSIFLSDFLYRVELVLLCILLFFVIVIVLLIIFLGGEREAGGRHTSRLLRLHAVACTAKPQA